MNAHARKIEPGAIISAAFEIYRDQAGTLLPLAFGLFAIEAVLAFALGPFVALVGMVLGILFQGMVVELVRDVQDGRRDSSVGQLYASVSPIMLPLIGIAILYALGVALGFIALIVPGLILLTIWAVAAPVAVVERPGVFASFSRSQQLVKGNGWPVFATIFIVFVMVLVFGMVAGAIGAGLGEAGQIVLQWVVNALVAPIAALTAAVLYFALAGPVAETVASAPSTPSMPGVPSDAPGGMPGGFEPPVAPEPKRDPERPDSVPPPGM